MSQGQNPQKNQAQAYAESRTQFRFPSFLSQTNHQVLQKGLQRRQLVMTALQQQQEESKDYVLPRKKTKWAKRRYSDAAPLWSDDDEEFIEQEQP